MAQHLFRFRRLLSYSISNNVHISWSVLPNTDQVKSMSPTPTATFTEVCVTSVCLTQMIQKTLVELRLSTRELLDCLTSVGRVLAIKGPAPKPGCARWKSNPSRTLWTTYMLHRSPKTIFEMTLECSRLFSTSVTYQNMTFPQKLQPVLTLKFILITTVWSDSK